MHLYYRFKSRFGTAGALIGVIALVLALVTGAYAAGGGLSGKQKKEVEKIAKKFAGKPGEPGAEGKQGPAGAPGANGTNGTNGANGKSVDVTQIPTGEPECAGNGGATVAPEGGSGTEVCNGQTGFTETLPPGKSETGTWAFGAATGSPLQAAISFPIPLESVIPAAHVHFLTEAEIAGGNLPADCEGGSEAEPKAKPGSLCVYSAGVGGATFNTFLNVEAPNGFGPGEAGRGGTVMLFNLIEHEPQALGRGDWIVTAPTS